MPITRPILRTGALALAALCFLAAPAAAETIVDLGNPAFAQVTGPTSIPIGHSEFCKQHADECRSFSGAVTVSRLTEERWNQLVDVNNRFNSSIVPITDQDFYHVAEFWNYPDGYGDCEDIALAKRRELIASGWNPSTLLMAVVRESNGNGHAVLMVRTDRGDMVLDNQSGLIKVWAETPYQFLKRQSQANAGQWVNIDDSRHVVVTTASTN